MTKAIDLAKQCGIAYYLTPEGTTEMHGTDRQIEAFAELVAEAEREACAKVCDDIQAKTTQWGPMAGYCAETIRALGSK